MPRRFSIAQQIEEVERELKLREGVYARSVASGAMRASVAEFHVDRLQAVLATLRWVSQDPGPTAGRPPTAGCAAPAAMQNSRALFPRAEHGVPRMASSRASAPPTWQAHWDKVRVHPGAVIAPEAVLLLFTECPPDAPLIEIGEGCVIEGAIAILRPAAKVSFGRRCHLDKAAILISAIGIRILDDSIVSRGATLVDSDNHSANWEYRQFDTERFLRGYLETGGRDSARHHDWGPVPMGEISVGPKAWVALNTIVLKGVTIGEGAVVGAGSVVTGDVPPWCVYAGNPAAEIKKLVPAP